MLFCKGVVWEGEMVVVCIAAAFPSVGTGVRYAPPRTPRRVNKEEGVVLAIRDRIVSRGCCCSIRRKLMSYGGTGAKPLCRLKGGCRLSTPFKREAGYDRADRGIE